MNALTPKSVDAMLDRLADEVAAPNARTSRTRNADPAPFSKRLEGRERRQERRRVRMGKESWLNS